MNVPVVSRWGSWRFHQSKLFQRFGEDAVEILSKVQLWRRPLQKIGGKTHLIKTINVMIDSCLIFYICVFLSRTFWRRCSILLSIFEVPGDS